jgi:hypothetical protein
MTTGWAGLEAWAGEKSNQKWKMESGLGWEEFWAKNNFGLLKNKRFHNLFTTYLNLKSRIKFKSNAFSNSNKFLIFSRNTNLILLNQGNFETQFKI